jgi:hypothetical protein
MVTKILFRLSISLVTLSLFLASPVYAYTGMVNGGNGGLGSGMGTGAQVVDEGVSTKSYGSKMYNQSNDDLARTKTTSNYDVSIYGTGTGSQFWNENSNAPGTANQTGYRATEATSTKNTKWGWLGLLGLLGFFGIRSRNSERNN